MVASSKKSGEWGLVRECRATESITQQKEIKGNNFLVANSICGISNNFNTDTTTINKSNKKGNLSQKQKLNKT